VVNGVFVATDSRDPIARSMQPRGEDALAATPSGLQMLPRKEIPLLPFGLVGVEALRSPFGGAAAARVSRAAPIESGAALPSLAELLPLLEGDGRGVISRNPEPKEAWAGGVS